jgi:Cyclin, N-terminal domain
VGEFVYITDDTYTKKQVLRMEHLILKVLTFDMSTPTILRFATKYNLTVESSETLKHLSQVGIFLFKITGIAFFTSCFITIMKLNRVSSTYVS